MSGLGRNRTTKQWSSYWENRKIDWKTSYFDTWNHPHRAFIVRVLQSIPWVSLFEFGCGAGANAVAIVKYLQGRQLGGVDINPEAIETAQKMFKYGLFKVGSMKDVMMSDSSVDVVLSDRALIYIDPFNIDEVISEMKRVAREYVVIAEFHNKSLWERIKLWYNSGYWSYNYKALLEKHGFYDVVIYKTPIEYWGENYYKHDHIIVAKVPKRK